MTQFSIKLKNLRLYKGLTQRQLAGRCDITEAEISFYETGIRKPGLDNIVKICKGLEVTATDLLGV